MMSKYIPSYDKHRGTAVFYAMDYVFGLGILGFLYAILNMILPAFRVISAGGIVYEFANFVWWAGFILYIILGPFYFWNKLKEWR